MSPTTASGIVASAYYNLAGTLQRKGQTDEAIVSYKKAVAANDEFITAHVLLGHALFGKGRLDEALAQYRKVLELRPGNGNDFGCVANVLNQQGHLAEAATYYEAALKVDPGNPVALNNYSRLLASSPDKAVRDGAKAVELARRLNQRTQGQNPSAIATLATAYAACGKFTDALHSIEQAQIIASSQGNADLMESLQGQRKLIEDERQ
jgi:tetratricopeptide (TPR) repeat protein